MAIFKASSYTKKATGAKASIRYIEHRPGKDNAKITRTLWGVDGKMERQEAYRMIDESQKGSYFYRLVISPDPVKEDTHRDIYVRDLTEKTMAGIEDLLQRQVQWVAATHDDHTPLRHVHVLAVLPKRLETYHLQALRDLTTEAAVEQRHQRDKIREQKQERGKEQPEWELQLHR